MQRDEPPTSKPKKSIFKRLLPERLLTRTLTILIAPVILVQLVMGIVFWNRHWSETTTTLAHNIATNVAAILHIVEREDDNPLYFQELQDFVLKQFDMNISRVKSQKSLPVKEKKAVSWRDSLTTDFLDEALQLKLKTPFSFQIQDPQIFIEAQSGDYQYTMSLHKRKLIPSATSLMIWWQVGAPLFFILIAALFMRNQVRPLLRLSAVVNQFGKGHDVSHFKPTGALEVRQVGHSFHRMRERIQKNIKQRTEMLAGISHDLKTPLTRMQLELALQPESESKTALLEDIRDMKVMVEDYLNFARGDGEESAKQVYLHEFLKSVFIKFPQDKVILAPFTKETAISCFIRPNAMSRALSNLITNALRYGNHVWFSVTTTQDHIYMVFEDDGPGIPASEYKNVFQPFYRIDASRNPATGGNGLGLSICKDIITKHGGNLKLEPSESHGGLKVIAKIPR